MRSKFREIVKYRAGALCLVGILAATYLHSTTFMSQFFYNSIILGAVAALAIDAGVVAMSIFKDELLKTGELAWMVRVVTVIVLFASGIANMSEGFKSAYNVELTYDSLVAMDLLTVVQWLAGTVVFPILAYVMCDTIGTRNLIEYKREMARHRSLKRPQKTNLPAIGAGRNGNLSAANNKIKQNKQRRMQMLEEYLEDYPDATLNDMADAIGVSSRETVRKYLNEMGQTSAFASNGKKFSTN
ncbi:MAG: hypothetical protein GWN00_17825 [Aliifodinibius sp.]|nr:hypothetical protein [Fodinibius sp.]NIY26593.1 hypothetical protein [Fodinibius sp.]